MTQRRADELTRTLADALRTAFAARSRRLQTIERRLDAFDLGRRLARNRTALVAVDGKLRQTVTARTHHARAQFGRLAGRLESLSPLAVLARGYAVCWNDERTKAIRDAADVATGDTIHVTLSRGAIAAKVSGIE
jgi:exodeoxyribonuclease VII large subunit